jgi:hypothetical protein
MHDIKNLEVKVVSADNFIDEYNKVYGLDETAIDK